MTFFDSLNDSIVGRAIAGGIGAIIAVGITAGIVFVYYLIVTPSRMKREAQRKYIRENALRKFPKIVKYEKKGDEK